MGSDRPAKRLHLAGKEERYFPTMDRSSENSTSHDSKTPLTSSRPQPIKSSKPCASDSRCQSRSKASYVQPNNKLENSTSSHVATGTADKKSKSLRPSPEVKSFGRPLGETSCSHVQRENVSSKLHMKGSLKPSTEKQINDLPLTTKPISVTHSGII